MSILSDSGSFAKKLLDWHTKNKRYLPWKADKDPYKIWVSEIILQQTRVDQGTPYYFRFLEAFPTIRDLAKASQDELLQVWQGLGYYARARNMHESARHVVKELKGSFPDNYDDLLRLKGIGPYTAAAISSFAFDEPRAVLDGNVIRIISRIFNISDPYDSGPGKKRFQQIADELLDTVRPADYNQAIMDFGALQCTPGIPDCDQCPMKAECSAYNLKTVDKLPVKQNKIIKKKRKFQFYLLLTPDHKIIIEKRIEKDIWKSLYQFPLFEPVHHSDIKPDVAVSKILKKFKYEGNHSINEAGKFKQTLTHQHIEADFYWVFLENDQLALQGNNYLVDYKNLCNFAYPKLIDWFIEEKIIPLIELKLSAHDQ